MGTVTFLSDYGLTDDFVGVCHAVIARIDPETRILDLTHGVPRHDVRTGALTLARALPYAPAGVHLAVVDPGVGAERRAVAVRCREEARVLVGPDNGLLMPAAAAFGGPLEAVDVSRSPHRLEPLAATFHGRDIRFGIRGCSGAATRSSRSVSTG
ncbi:MAG: SAM-dependent chlorinase/fluorinase [Solirubrobacteraceae bacterium]